MSWWSWVLIWAGLVVALIAVLIACSITLFRKAAAAVHELERLEVVRAEGARLAQAAQRDRDAAHQVTPLAIGRSAATAIAHYRQVRENHLQQRERRRAARIVRGRALTKADPLQYRYLAAVRANRRKR